MQGKYSAHLSGDRLYGGGRSGMGNSDSVHRAALICVCLWYVKLNAQINRVGRAGARRKLFAIRRPHWRRPTESVCATFYQSTLHYIIILQHASVYMQNSTHTAALRSHQQQVCVAGDVEKIGHNASKTRLLFLAWCTSSILYASSARHSSWCVVTKSLMYIFKSF